ncbi:GIY-YIG nuclease family protein [Halomonas organivorans]
MAGEADWSLYVLETAAGALYTGITTDVSRRLAQHRAGRGAKALRGKGPLRLVYQERVGEHGEALRREAALKRLSAVAKRRWLTERQMDRDTGEAFP